MASTNSESESFLVTVQYSSILKPDTFPITNVPLVRKSWSKGSSLSIASSTPGFWSPIAFKIPPAVSTIRGGGLPLRGFAVIALTVMPPKMLKS